MRFRYTDLNMLMKLQLMKNTEVAGVISDLIEEGKIL